MVYNKQFRIKQRYTICHLDKEDSQIQINCLIEIVKLVRKKRECHVNFYFIAVVFYPIIPMVLVNGAEGIGMGWKTSVPCHNPRDIVKVCLYLSNFC